MVSRLHADAINEGPASPVSSRRLCGTLSPLGAPPARRTRRQACLASCAHRSVRRHAADALRHLACLRAAGLAAARAAIMMGARTARRRRVLLSAAPLGAHAPAGAGGGCSERAERRPLADGRGGRGRGGGGGGADGRERRGGRAIGCAPLALLNFAAARAPRDAWGGGS